MIEIEHRATLMTPLDPRAAIQCWHAHGALDVFVHPNTGDVLVDHRDRALWLGRAHALDLAALEA